MDTIETNYHAGIYDALVTARGQLLALPNPDGLAPRWYHQRQLIRTHFPANKNAAIVDLDCDHGTTIHLAREAGYAVSIALIPGIRPAARTKREGKNRRGSMPVLVDGLYR